jgi:hypothetical protein
MDIATFRTTQEPFKELYRKDAKAAFLTLRAKGTADESAVIPARSRPDAD